jgi:membrane protease YdiL (CAAX protease family)
MEVRLIEIRILVLSVAAVLATEALIIPIILQTACPPMLALGIARLLETMLLFLIVTTPGKGMASIGLDRNNIISGLKKGLIWSVAFGLCALLGFAVLFAARINPLNMIKTGLPPNTLELALYFAVGGLVGPVAEEVFFRGIIYGFLRRWGVLAAILGTTVIFVVAHSVRTGVPLTQIIGGIVFAIAYEMEGNLMVPIVIHVLGNMAIFALSLMS